MARPVDQNTAEAHIVEDEHGRILNDPTHTQPLDHGNSTAAWALVLLVLVGMTVACVGLLAASTILFWIGMILMILGPIAGFVLRQMGYGTGGEKSQSNH